MTDLAASRLVPAGRIFHERCFFPTAQSVSDVGSGLF